MPKQMVFKLLGGSLKSSLLFESYCGNLRYLITLLGFALNSYALKRVVELFMSSKLVKHCRAYGHYGATDKIADKRPRKLNTAAV